MVLARSPLEPMSMNGAVGGPNRRSARLSNDAAEENELPVKKSKRNVNGAQMTTVSTKESDGDAGVASKKKRKGEILRVYRSEDGQCRRVVLTSISQSTMKMTTALASRRASAQKRPRKRPLCEIRTPNDLRPSRRNLRLQQRKHPHQQKSQRPSQRRRRSEGACRPHPSAMQPRNPSVAASASRLKMNLRIDKPRHKELRMPNHTQTTSAHPVPIGRSLLLWRRGGGVARTV